jgi:hypothetical protein
VQIMKSAAFQPKYYYFDYNGSFTPSGHYEKPKIKELPYIKLELIEVTRKQPIIKRLRLSKYSGNQEFPYKETPYMFVEVPYSTNTSANMVGSAKLLTYIKSQVDSFMDEDKGMISELPKKSISDNLYRSYYDAYYNTLDRYPYKPGILTTSEKNNPDFMKRLELDETLRLERKRKLIKSKPKRKVIKKKKGCGCK